MPDRYAQLVNTPIGKLVAKQVGLPTPPALERYAPGQPVISGPVLLGAATGSRLAAPRRGACLARRRAGHRDGGAAACRGRRRRP